MALREAFPAMIRGSTQIQPTLKQGQRVTIGGATTGTVQEAGSFSVILKDDPRQDNRDTYQEYTR